MMIIRPTKSGKFPNVLAERDWFFGDVALGNMTQYEIMAVRLSSAFIFIGIQGRSCYTFTGFAHKDYVKARLHLRYELDARNLADFINAQIDNDYAVQGAYTYPNLCEGE
jgi:hypothetical protein